MNKKGALFLILFLLITPQYHVHAAESQNTIPFSKVIPYLVECGLIAGGVATSVIGYLEKRHCGQKIALLQRLEQYCQQHNIATTTLVNKEIFFFAQQLQQESLLLEIIHNNETQTSLKNEAVWQNGLLYGGGFIILVGVVALIITVFIHLNDYHAQQVAPPQPQKHNPQTLPTENPSPSTTQTTTEPDPTPPTSEFKPLQKKQMLDVMHQQEKCSREMWTLVKNELDKTQYKNFEIQPITKERLHAAVTMALQQKDQELTRKTKDLIQKKVVEKIDSILQDAQKGGHGTFNERVKDNSSNRFGLVHTSLIHDRRSLEERE